MKGKWKIDKIVSIILVAVLVVGQITISFATTEGIIPTDSTQATEVQGDADVAADEVQSEGKDTTEGEKAEGEVTEGENTEGEAPEGEKVEGDVVLDADGNPVAADAAAEDAEAAEEEAAEPEINMPAQTLTKTAADNAKITVTAPEGALPENSQVKVKVVSSNSVKDAIEGEVGAVDEIAAYDITLHDADGKEVQPEAPVDVKIARADIEGEAAEVVHVKDDKESAEVVDSSTKGKTATFEAEHFSIYAVITRNHKTIPTSALRYDGKSGRANYYTLVDKVIIGDVITITSDNKNSDNWYIENGYANDVITFSFNGSQCTITAKKVGTTRIVHSYKRGLLTYWEAIDITVKADGDVAYFYGLNPGTPIGANISVDEKWYGLKKGIVKGAPDIAGVGTNVDISGSYNLTYDPTPGTAAAGSFPNITYAGETLVYAPNGSAASREPGHYTLDFMSFSRQGGANPGKQSNFTPVNWDVQTWHVNCVIIPIMSQYMTTSFYVQNPGSSNFAFQTEQYKAYKKGTVLSEVTQPSTADKTVNGITYKFDGWYTDQACTQKADFTNGKLDTNMTFYGKYVEKELSETAYFYVLRPGRNAMETTPGAWLYVGTGKLTNIKELRTVLPDGGMLVLDDSNRNKYIESKPSESAIVNAIKKLNPSIGDVTITSQPYKLGRPQGWNDETGAGRDEGVYCYHVDMNYSWVSNVSASATYMLKDAGASDFSQMQQEDVTFGETTSPDKTKTPYVKVVGGKTYKFDGWHKGSITGEIATFPYTITKAEGGVTFYAEYKEADTTDLTLDLSNPGPDWTKVYNGKDQTVTKAVSEKVGNVTVSGITVSATGKDVGTYKATFTGTPKVTDAEGNDVTPLYNVTVKTGDLTITQRPVTVTANKETKVYGTADPAFTGKIEPAAGDRGLVDGDTLGTITYARTNAAQEEIGVYEEVIEPTVSGANANYNITTKNGNFEITQNNEEVVVDIIGNNKTVEYNGALQYVEGFKSNVKGADAADITVSLANGKTARAEGKNASDTPYLMNLKDDMFELSSDKYTNIKIGSITDGWLKINKKDVSKNPEDPTNPLPDDQVPTVAVVGNTATATYDGTLKTVSDVRKSITDPGKNYPAFTDDDIIVTFKNGAKAEAAGTNASDNKYMMGLTNDDIEVSSQNYTGFKVAGVTDGWLQINKAKATVKVDSTGKAFNTPDPAAFTGNVTGLMAGDQLANLTYARVAGEEPGEYPINATFDENPNYNVTVVPGTFTISKNAEEVVVTVTGKSETVDYNGKEQSVKGYDVLFPLGVDGSKIDLKLNKNEDQIAKGTNAGTYTMELSDKSFTADGGKYYENIKLVVNPGTLTINKKDVSEEAKVRIVGNKKQEQYSGTEKTLEGYNAIVESTNPLFEKDQIEVKYLKNGEPSVAATNVGGHDLVIDPADFEVTSENFIIGTPIFENGMLTITTVKATITVDKASKEVGAKDPEFTGNVSGLVGNDKELEGIVYKRVPATGTTPEEAVGTYEGVLTAEYPTSGLNSNYYIEVVPGDFEITKIKSRNLKLTFGPQQLARYYNGTEQSLTGYKLTKVRDWKDNNNYTSVEISKGKRIEKEVVKGETVNSTSTAFVGDSLDPAEFGLTITMTPEAEAGLIANGTDVRWGKPWGSSPYWRPRTINGEQWSILCYQSDSNAMRKAQYQSDKYSKISFDTTSTNNLYIVPAPLTIEVNSVEKTATQPDPDAIGKATAISGTNYNITNGSIIPGDTVNVAVTREDTSDKPGVYPLKAVVTDSNPGASVNKMTGRKGVAHSNGSADITGANGWDILGNYEITTKAGNLTIKADETEQIVKITGNTATATYDGTEKKAIGYNAEIPDGTDIKVSLKQGTAAEIAGTNAGTYPMGLNEEMFQYESDKYNNVKFVIVKDGELTIDKERVNINIRKFTKQFNTADPDFNSDAFKDKYVEVKGKPDKGADLNVTYKRVNQGGADTPLEEEVGAYTGVVTAVYAEDENPNYDIVATPGDFEIVQNADDMVTVNIVGNNDTVEYNGSKQSVEGYDVVSITDAAGNAVKDGIVDIKLADGVKAIAEGTDASDDNYEMGLTKDSFKVTSKSYKNFTVNVTDGWLKINKKDVTGDKALIKVEGNSLKNVYTGAVQSVEGFDYTVENTTKLGKDDVKVVYTDGEAKAEGTTVGKYNMGLNDSNIQVLSKNFTGFIVVVEDGVLEITERPVKITSLSAEKPFNGTPLVRNEFSVSEGSIADGQRAVVEITGTITHVGEEDNTIAGVIVYDASNNNVTDNYYVKTEEGTLKITKAGADDLLAQFDVEGVKKVYDGKSHSATVDSKTVTGFTTSYRKSIGGGDWTEGLPSATNVKESGTYDIKISHPDYEDAVKKGVEITITERPVNIIANDKVAKYGQPVPTLDGSVELFDEANEKGLVDGDSIDNIEYKLFDRIGGYDKVGKYEDAITATYTDNPNYKEIVVYGDYTVIQNDEDTITVTITGNTKTVKYNGDEQKVEGYDVKGAVDGAGNVLSAEELDQIEVKLAAGAEAVAKGTDASDAKYMMNLNKDSFVGTSGNYKYIAFDVTDGWLKIDKKDVSKDPEDPAKPLDDDQIARVVITGNSRTVTFNGSEQSVTGYTFSVTNNGTGHKDFTTGSVNVALKAGKEAEAKGTEVGAYPMVLSEDMFDVTSTNYEGFVIEVVNGELTINPVPVGPTPYIPDPDTPEPTPVTPTPTPVTPVPTPATPVAPVAPAVPTPAAPAIAAVPPAAIPAPATVIADNATPLANTNIDDNETPLAVGANHWALLNLLLTILTAIMSVVLIALYFTKKRREDEDEYAEQMEYDEEEQGIKRKGLPRVLSAVWAVLMIVVFFLTEDMTLPMQFTDKWTWLMIVMTVVQLVIAFMSKKKYEENEDEEAQA